MKPKMTADPRMINERIKLRNESHKDGHATESDARGVAHATSSLEPESYTLAYIILWRVIRFN